MIRRGLARRKDLPEDVKERFAADEDFAVRLLLAENNDDVPVELLLEIGREWEDCRNGGSGNASLTKDCAGLHSRMRALALTTRGHRRSSSTG